MQLFIIFLFLLFCPAYIQPAFADGMVYGYDPDMMRWNLLKEEWQLATINYENGVQNMILSIGLNEMYGEKAVWLFPVPARPDEINIDIIKGLPKFFGYDVNKMRDFTISGAFSLMALSQIYPLPFIAIIAAFLTPRGFLKGGAEADLFELTGGLGDKITIHQHIEKMGLTTELISTKKSDIFYDYLTNKGLSLPSSSKVILDEYIGNEYSFVASWISNVSKFKEESVTQGMTNTIGTFITFPTDKIYFPLKPTSIYGNMKVPILIYVVGHTAPQLYPKVKQKSQINYFVEDYYIVPPEMSSFFNKKTEIEDLKYTKIKIEMPSRYLKEDLWIENSVPRDVAIANFINRNAWIWGILVFVLISCLASLFSGMIIFRKEKISKKRLALFGLGNFLTLIGFAIASRYLRPVKLDLKELEQQAKSQGLVIFVYDKRKDSFVLLFSIFFLIIGFVFFQIMLHL